MLTIGTPVYMHSRNAKGEIVNTVTGTVIDVQTTGNTPTYHVKFPDRANYEAFEAVNARHEKILRCKFGRMELSVLSDK